MANIAGGEYTVDEGHRLARLKVTLSQLRRCRQTITASSQL